MDTLEKTKIEIWPLAIYVTFGGSIVVYGPIDFLFGLLINLNVNEQNKFEVDVLKNVAKIVNFKPKIGQL